MAIKKRIRGLEIFSISFLDIISCGFGAIIILVLLSKTAAVGGTANVERITDLLKALNQAEITDAKLQSESRQLLSSVAQSSQQKKQLIAGIEKNHKTLSALQIQGSQLADEIAILKAAHTPPSATISADETDRKSPYAGGIPVDSNYIVFIVDTSGSMKRIWERVMMEMENILDIHPKVKGFQILNDNGHHLISAYQGKWIPDTVSRRKSILELLRTWNAFSNSSPVEGLETALRLYSKAGQKTSIYILGDDYTGNSYNDVLNTISRANINLNKEPIARIHGIGFTSGNPDRFGILMREVARQSRGTFIALN